MNKLFFIPTAYPFSDFDLEDKPEDFGDHEDSQGKMYSDVSANYSVLKILRNLHDRHKIVFMFLLLKESGYELTYEDCAKTLSISRQAYMKLTKTVRMKAKKLLQDSI